LFSGIFHFFGAGIPRESLQKALSGLRKVLRSKGIAVEKYENDLAKITDPGTVVEIAAAVAAAGNPGSYMKRRFGH